MSDTDLQVWQLEIAEMARVSDMERELVRLRADLNNARESAEMHRAARDKAVASHRADIDTLSAALLREAEDRDWCNEFDEFVEGVNRHLTYELTERAKTFDVEVPIYVTVTVTARDEGIAADEANEIIRAIESFADRQPGTTSSVGDFETIRSDT